MPEAASLHIGLNAVDPKQYSGWSGELTACEFDAKDMQTLARKKGFSTKTRLTKSATRSKVLADLKAAASKLRKNGIFFLTYSGHGGQVPNTGNDYEPDGFDETWCLYDGELIEEGMDQPYRFPGGQSGVTIGHGYDLSAETAAELYHDWGKWLSKEQLDRLKEAVGKSGPQAAQMCRQFEDIKISTEAADDVFYRYTVPKYYEQTLETFPNMDAFPGVVQGALLSLVFNRGTSLEGGRREEMRKIRDLLASNAPQSQILEEIATQLRKMKSLWIGKGLDGLVIRREKEARWVESAIA